MSRMKNAHAHLRYKHWYTLETIPVMFWLTMISNWSSQVMAVFQHCQKILLYAFDSYTLDNELQESSFKSLYLICFSTLL